MRTEWIDKKKTDGLKMLWGRGTAGEGSDDDEDDARADGRVVGWLKKVGLAGTGERSVPHATVWIDESLAFNHARDW